MRASRRTLVFLAVTVLGMITAVSSRPLPHDSDILSGVDFLSMFIHSSRSTTRSPRTTFKSPSTTLDPVTTLPVEQNTVTTFEDERTTFPDIVTTFKDPGETKTTFTEGETTFANRGTTFADGRKTFAEKDRTFADGETNFANRKITFSKGEATFSNRGTTFAEGETTFADKDRAFADGETNFANRKTTFSEERTTFLDDVATTEVVTVNKDISAIVSNNKRNEFTVDESDVIMSKVKRKSEDLLAIGANPDYIAQQQSRKANIYSYNHPYTNRQPLTRSRSVSYSTVIQSLPNSPVISKPNYEYTESYPQNKTKHVDSTAESKDYFVTRKYNPDEYNESTDKPKKSYEPTERNWGIPEKNYELPNRNLPTIYGKPEQNYEIDESVSVMTNGRAHGIQSKPTEKPTVDDNQKVGYVVEGRNYKKYRVEERTSDGFIVGEYGVVSNNDGSLRGVRYTADGTINPRVIYDALMKFLAL